MLNSFNAYFKIPDYTMKRRKMHAWGLLLVGLIMSSQINSGLAGRMGASPRDHQQQQLHQQQIHQRQQRQLQVVHEFSVSRQCGESDMRHHSFTSQSSSLRRSQPVQRTHPGGSGGAAAPTACMLGHYIHNSSSRAILLT